jgi:galactokinase
MIGNILNHLYSDGKVQNAEIAKISQFAENVYFGKPSGLMDQMACAVGGFVYIDFENKEAPTVEPLSLSLRDAGYELAIINTGGNHADLNDDYASVPAEMRSVAAFFGKEVLREVSEEELYSNIAPLRESVGDRAVLRSIHYMNENSRVSRGREAIVSGSLERFFGEVRSSGLSSFTYLQNVYTNKNVSEQGLSLALALIDSFGEGVGAFRVHGGGFAGTVQAYVKSDEADRFTEYMERVFGKGSVMRLSIRPEGAVRLF